MAEGDLADFSNIHVSRSSTHGNYFFCGLVGISSFSHYDIFESTSYFPWLGRTKGICCTLQWLPSQGGRTQIYFVSTLRLPGLLLISAPQ